MALKIVQGGTTGAADGTLVDSGHPLVVVALNTAIDAHIRCDDGYWSNDQSFDVPAELRVSFDAGSTWYGNGDEPITAPEIYAVNYPIKVKQVTAASSTSGSFVTDGTYTAIAALSTPTLTATVISASQIDLSWTNVSNEDASPGYTLEWSPNGSTGWTGLGAPLAANTTTYSHTGLTASTHYYYRVKAEGSGRYSDSSYGTGDDTTTNPIFASDDFNTGSGDLVGTTPDMGGNWTDGSEAGSPSPVYASNRVRQEDSPTSFTYVATTPASADYYVQADVIPQSGGSGGVAGVIGRKTAGTGSTTNYNLYWADYYDHATAGSRQWRLIKAVGGSVTVLGTYTENIGTTTKTLKLEMIGTAIKLYVDGVQRVSVTDSSVTAAGRAGVVFGAAASPTTNAIFLDNFVAS